MYAIDKNRHLDPIESTLRLPGLKPRVCSGLILSGALKPGLKIGVGAVERIKGVGC
jgi:hypothetical protein